jgi:hypothetical protein
MLSAILLKQNGRLGRVPNRSADRIACSAALIPDCGSFIDTYYRAAAANRDILIPTSGAFASTAMDDASHRSAETAAQPMGSTTSAGK